VAATGEVRKPRPQVRDLRAEKAGIVVTSGTGAPPVAAKAPKPAPKSKLAPQPRKPVEPVAPPPVRVRDENREPQPRRAGKIGILGRPNVGKSTLINALLGTRVAITSHHPQTTRDRIAGIVVRDDTQFVFLDTPGIHQARTKLGQRMNAFARDVGVEADVVLFVTDLAKDPTSELRSIDAELLSQLPTNKPVLLLINKIDKLERMDLLLPILEGHAKAFPWATIVPVSAYKKDGLDAILSAIENYLPQQDFLFPEDDISDKPIRFFVAEFVREAILRRTREEVPHGVAVTIDAFDEAPRVPRIDLTVHVDKDSHKPIILGARGTALQIIGTRARARVEELLGRQVHLQIHVRVTPGWYENEARLAEFGYTPTED
jgi:GTP-binding protein Era